MTQAQSKSSKQQEIKVKKLIPSEAQLLSEIDKYCNIPPWSTKLFKQEIQGNHSESLGAYADRYLIGFIIFHKLFESAHIVTFGVEPKWRRQGVGNLLLSAALQKMYTSAISWVTLEVRASNQPAISLYQNAGFNEAGVREKYYSNNKENALVLKASVLDFIHTKGDPSVLI
ncbi:MAG: ribosomal protein S18-alanine N-acetyltransferase [Bdellovibrionota bacterium]